jgi:hypothetical protein
MNHHQLDYRLLSLSTIDSMMMRWLVVYVQMSLSTMMLLTVVDR